MEQQQHIALAYCIDNIQLAEQIAQEMASVGHAPQHYYGSKSSPDKPLFEQLKNHSGPILLLVTDNFLRSAQCMANGREFMQDNRDAVLPIVADGTRQDESRNAYAVPTQFERISDIIQYINYWQDQYLDLRRQKRELEAEIDEATFNEHLRTVRAISGETSEFLRLLRNTEHVTYEELDETHYEAIFRFIGETGSWDKLKKARLERVMDRVPAEAVSASRNRAEEMDEAEVDIRDIPGMDLLPDEEDQVVEEEEEEIVPDTPEAAHESPTEESAAEKAPLNGSAHDQETVEPEMSAAAESEPGLNPDEVLANIHDWISGGQTDHAIEQLRAVLEEHPANLAVRYQLAFLLVRHEDDFSEARRQLATLLKYDSKHTGALFLSGELSEIEEDFDEAVGFYEDVARIDPHFPDVQYRLGHILAYQFDDTQDQAIEAFREAIGQNPDNADAWYQYGMLLNEHRGEREAAAEAFQQVLVRQPNHPFAYYDLALIYHARGDMAQAQQAYLQAKKLNPEVETPENDLAFGLAAPPEPAREEATPAPETKSEAPAPPAPPVPEKPLPGAGNGLTIEHDALAALKENIMRLEEMIRSRDQEEEVAEPEPPRPGAGITVLIAGVHSDIGRATAGLFADNGFRIILADRGVDELQATIEELSTDEADEIHGLEVDLSDAKSVQQAIEGLPEAWRRIDILINNSPAGEGPGSLIQGDMTQWEIVIDKQLRALLYLTGAIAPAMVQRREGTIINVGADKEVAGAGEYLSKKTMDALTRSLRKELHQHQLRICQITAIEQAGQTVAADDVADAVYYAATRPPQVNIQDLNLYCLSD